MSSISAKSIDNIRRSRQSQKQKALDSWWLPKTSPKATIPVPRPKSQPPGLYLSQRSKSQLRWGRRNFSMCESTGHNSWCFPPRKTCRTNIKKNKLEKWRRTFTETAVQPKNKASPEKVAKCVLILIVLIGFLLTVINAHLRHGQSRRNRWRK